MSEKNKKKLFYYSIKEYDEFEKSLNNNVDKYKYYSWAYDEIHKILLTSSIYPRCR